MLGIICIALLRYYNLSFGGEYQGGYNQASYHDRYLFGVMTIGGMLLVTIPIFVAHLFGSEIRPGLVTTTTDRIVSTAFYIFLFNIRNQCAQDLIYSTMGFVLFLTAGILSLDFYVIYRNRPGNLNAGRSLGVNLLEINLKK